MPRKTRKQRAAARRMKEQLLKRNHESHTEDNDSNQAATACNLSQTHTAQPGKTSNNPPSGSNQATATSQLSPTTPDSKGKSSRYHQSHIFGAAPPKEQAPRQLSGALSSDRCMYCVWQLCLYPQ